MTPVDWIDCGCRCSCVCRPKPCAVAGRHSFTWSGDYWGYCDHCGAAPDGEDIEILERLSAERPNG